MNRRDLLKLPAVLTVGAALPTSDRNRCGNQYVPLPWQSRLHQDESPRRLVLGERRAGATLATAVEVARCAATPQGNGRIAVVGDTYQHIGRVWYPALFESFFDARGVPADPLIPAAMVRRIQWWDKARRGFRRVELVNGAIIEAVSLSFPTKRLSASHAFVDAVAFSDALAHLIVGRTPFILWNTFDEPSWSMLEWRWHYARTKDNHHLTT